METFEIHITGDGWLLEAAEKLKLKTIIVNLLHPNKKLLRTEYMTSHILKCENYVKCKEIVDHYSMNLVFYNAHIIRVKIESPYYPHYKDQSCYLESHFDAVDDRFPISQNAKKESFMATDRTYNKDEYDNFKEKYKDSVVELCLYDSFVEEDRDWFDLYSNKA